MAAIIEFLQDIWFFLVDFFLKNLDKTQAAGLQFDSALYFRICFGFLFCMGSACWASSIASMRRHSLWLHFPLGFILPWIYPIILLFTLDIAGESERRKREAEILAKRAEEEEEKLRIQEEVRSMQGTAALEEALANGNWSKDYFTAIARDANGDNAGPWKAVVAGDDVFVLEILEVEDDLILVKYRGYNGEPSKLRIPFSKLESWEKTQEA